jgi:hypothetical protein
MGIQLKNNAPREEPLQWGDLIFLDVQEYSSDPDNYDPDNYDPDNYDRDNYGPDNYDRDNYGPDNYGPDNYGPDNYGPDNYGSDNYGPDNHDVPLLPITNYSKDDPRYLNFLDLTSEDSSDNDTSDDV